MGLSRERRPTASLGRRPIPLARRGTSAYECAVGHGMRDDGGVTWL